MKTNDTKPKEMTKKEDGWAPSSYLALASLRARSKGFPRRLPALQREISKISTAETTFGTVFIRLVIISVIAVFITLTWRIIFIVLEV